MRFARFLTAAAFHAVLRACPSLLLAGMALALVPAAASEAGPDGVVLVRVERQSREDLSRLLAGGVPVVMEMRDCLFVEATADDLEWLDERGYRSAVVDRETSSSDYLVIGLRPDSSTSVLTGLGTVIHREQNWLVLRVHRGVAIESLASARVFVTRMPHEPLEMPRETGRTGTRGAEDLATPDPLVQAIADRVSPTSIDQVWEDLVSNPPTGTRYSTHQGCLDAAAYCSALYAGLGLSAQYQQWSPSHAPNVIATQPGALYPDDVYIIVGHLDDLPAFPPAPGADDNASGSVTVLEAARVMSCYTFKSTVKYLNVTGEESGLLGSDAYADDAWARGENVLGVINMDMNAWEGDGAPAVENLDVNFNTASEWLGLLFAECAQKYGTGLAVDAFYCPSLSASDHYPFWQRGWSAICGITDNEGYCGHGGNYPYYHTSNDTIENVGDPAFFHSAVRTSVATLAELAEPFKIVTDRPAYACGAGIGVVVGDRDLDADPGLRETAVVEAWSDTEPTPESITLDERTISSSVFEGVAPTSQGPAVAGDGVVAVAPGDTVTVRYVDALDCDGAGAVPYTAAATIDCTAPVISNVIAGAITGDRATISWDTDEASDSSVTYGELVPGTTVTTVGEVTSHAVMLDGLAECTTYRYSVTSTDEAGNAATDDNQGAYYQFATGVDNQPEFPSTDTPRPIVDYSTFTSTLTVSDDDTVLDVDVRLDVTHTYDGDLDIFLIGPGGTRVELTTDNGGSGNDFTDTVFDDEAPTSIAAGSAPFTGRFRPEGALDALDGQPASGTWGLEVTDDAGNDQGQLLGWTLILTYAATPCGPVARYASHGLEVDSCATGSGGLGNGLWEPGEQVEFSVAVRNDGTGPITGATATVTPLSAGVTMIDATASVGDIAPGATQETRAPHFIARLSDSLACGAPLDFDVTIASPEGSWPATFRQTVGELVAERGGVTLSEDFPAGIPATWTVIDRSRSGPADGFTWTADNASDPSGCGSPDPAAPIAGTWVVVDSSCTGGGDRMDEELITPALDLTGDPVVTLEFDHWFEANQNEVADVDIRSSLTGGAWVNLARWSGSSTPNPQHEILDISEQAGNAPDVQIRWHYHDAQAERYWYVDNVEVRFLVPETCNMVACTPAASSPPPIPGDMRAGRSQPDGSEISVAWNDSCLPTSTKIVYGPLDQVSSHAITGSVCSINNPHSWTPVLAGDLWFVLIAEDGAGVESSWGPATDGERNGLNASGTCGSAVKDLAATCP